MQRMSDGAGRGTVRCRHGIQHYAQTSEEYIAFVEKHAELKVAPRSESLVVELEPDNLFQAQPRSASMLCIPTVLKVGIARLEAVGISPSLAR
jgi:hypothetical protein